jgi:hypothetical protein
MNQYARWTARYTHSRELVLREDERWDAKEHANLARQRISGIHEARWSWLLDRSDPYSGDDLDTKNYNIYTVEIMGEQMRTPTNQTTRTGE